MSWRAQYLARALNSRVCEKSSGDRPWGGVDGFSLAAASGETCFVPFCLFLAALVV